MSQICISILPGIANTHTTLNSNMKINVKIMKHQIIEIGLFTVDWSYPSKSTTQLESTTLLWLAANIKLCSAANQFIKFSMGRDDATTTTKMNREREFDNNFRKGR